MGCSGFGVEHMEIKWVCKDRDYGNIPTGMASGFLFRRLGFGI